MRSVYGSVKNIEIDREPTPRLLGKGDFVFTRRYSIFDLKQMPDKIPGREALAAIAAYNFELLENNGIKTHYWGVVNSDDRVVPLNKMQEPPTRMRVRLAAVHKPAVRIAGGRLSFSYSYFDDNRGRLNNFVLPIEFIYRNGLPEGSSVLRRLRDAEARGDTAYIEKQLKKLGLSAIPAPNTMLPQPFGDYTTKFEPLGDRNLGDDEDAKAASVSGDYSRSEALRISGLTPAQFAEVIGVRNRAAQVIRKRGEEVGIVDWDGKDEYAWADGPMVVDVKGSPDENRWFYNGQHVSKEFLRQLYDVAQPELRKDVERAQGEAAEDAVKLGQLHDWRDYMTVRPMSLNEIEPNIIPLAGEMHMALANQWTGIQFYNTRPLGAVMKDLTDAVAGIKQRYEKR